MSWYQRRPSVTHLLQVHDQVVEGKLTQGLGREERHIFQDNTSCRGKLGHLVQYRRHIPPTLVVKPQRRHGSS